MSKGILDIH